MNNILVQIEELIKKYSYKEDSKEDVYGFIHNNSEEFIRRILNTAVSKILNLPVNESFTIVKDDDRVVNYFELRIMIQLRNSSFKLKNFIAFVEQMQSEYSNLGDYHDVDLQLFKVLPIFKKYIKDPNKLDQLVLTHQYVKGLWSNGRPLKIPPQI